MCQLGLSTATERDESQCMSESRDYLTFKLANNAEEPMPARNSADQFPCDLPFRFRLSGAGKGMSELSSWAYRERRVPKVVLYLKVEKYRALRVQRKARG
jgi:hypothetical protein